MEFSIKRIGLLLKMQGEENKRTYLLGLLAICSLIFIVGLFIVNFHIFDKEVQSATFQIGLFVSSILFTTRLLNGFDAKTTTIQTLMLPVSALERIAVSLLWIIIFPIVYTATVYPVIVFVNYIDNAILGVISPTGESSFTLSYAYPYIIIQLLALLLSLFFRKQVFIKTAVVLILSIISLIAVQMKVMDKFVRTLNPEKVKNSGYKNLSVYEKADGKEMRLRQSLDFERAIILDDELEEFELALSDKEKNVFNLLSLLFIPFLLATTIQKFKEKQL